MKQIIQLALASLIAVAVLPASALALEHSPASYDFGQIDVQDVAPKMTWTVSSNYPGANNNLSAISVPSGFVISNNACAGGSLSFGGSCTAKFAPVNSVANIGPLNGTATVSSTFDLSASLPLTAEITQRVLAVDPASSPSLGAIALGGTDKHSSIELTNSGSGVVAIDSLGMIGDVAALSANVSGCVGVKLGPNEKCSMPVTLAASNPGSFATSISVTSNDAAFVDPIELSGSVVAPVAQVTPAALDFGLRSVGGGPSELQVATVENDGLVELSLGQPVLEGNDAPAFVLAFSSCGAVLLPGSQCKLALAFDPAAAGGSSAMLRLPTSEPGGSRQVALSGVGTVDQAAPTPASGLRARFSGSTHLGHATRLSFRFDCPTNSCIVTGSLKLTFSKRRALKLKANTAGALAEGKGTLSFEISKRNRRTIARWLRGKKTVRATATLTDVTPGRKRSVVVKKSLRR